MIRDLTGSSGSGSGRIGQGGRLGPYQLEEAIGRGGMGAVYRARHLQTGAQHAVKVILASRLVDSSAERALARFHREVEVLARIEPHPSVVQVHSSGVEKGVPWCAMDFVDGRPLSTELDDKRRLSPDAAARLVAKLARALHHCHQHGVVHRDMKPENVLLDVAGQPRIVDFGLAYDAFAENLTRTGECLGTPAYMAPEQVSRKTSGERLPGQDAATDVYGLGALLYKTLTGRRPFEGREALAMMVDIVRNPPRPLRAHDPAIPAELEAVALKALEKSPFDRFESAAAMADELEAWLRGESITTSNPSHRWSRMVPAWLKPRTRGGRIAAAGLAASLLFGAIAAVTVVTWRSDMFGPPPSERLDALADALEMQGRLDTDQLAQLDALIARPALEREAALARRAACLRLVARLATGHDAAAAAELAERARSDGRVDQAVLDHAARVLQQTGRLPALAVLLWGAEPPANVSPSVATELARAVAGASSRDAALAPPEDDATFSALLRAPRIDDAVRGRLLVRRGEQALGRGELGFDVALESFERAFRRHGVASRGEGWTPAFRRHATLALAEKVAALDPNAADHAAMLIWGGCGDIPPDADVAARLQTEAGIDTLFSEGLHTPSAREVEKLLIVGAFQTASDTWPVHADKLYYVFEQAIGQQGLLELGEQERSKEPARRDPARLAFLAVLIANHEPSLERADAVMKAAVETGIEQPWLYGLVARYEQKRRRFLEAFRAAERAYELDEGRPLELRRHYVADRYCVMMMEIANVAPELYDIPTIARLAMEAYRLHVHGKPFVQAITDGGGMAPYSRNRHASLASVLASAAQRQVLAKNGACCGDDARRIPNVEDLVEVGLKTARDPLAQMNRAVDVEGEGAGAETTLLTVLASHRIKHGRHRDAYDAVKEAIDGEVRNQAISQVQRVNRAQRLAALHRSLADILAALGRRAEAQDALARARSYDAEAASGR